MNPETKTVPFNPNPTPKARFQESSDNIKKHQAMIATGEFRRALDFTLLEYERWLAESATDPVKAQVAGIKNQGVHEFLIQLLYLAEKPLPVGTLKIVDALPDETQNRRS